MGGLGILLRNFKKSSANGLTKNKGITMSGNDNPNDKVSSSFVKNEAQYVITHMGSVKTKSENGKVIIEIPTDRPAGLEKNYSDDRYRAFGAVLAKEAGIGDAKVSVTGSKLSDNKETVTYTFAVDGSDFAILAKGKLATQAVKITAMDDKALNDITSKVQARYTNMDYAGLKHFDAKGNAATPAFNKLGPEERAAVAETTGKNATQEEMIAGDPEKVKNAIDAFRKAHPQLNQTGHDVTGGKLVAPQPTTATVAPDSGKPVFRQRPPM